MSMKDIKFPSYINTSERSITVVGLIEDGKLDYIDGKGYVDKNDKIWIFCSEEPNKAFVNEYPYFWINKDGKIKKSNPYPIMQKAYDVSNIQDLSLHTVIDKTIPGEKLYNESEIMDINASSSFYIPTIYSNDDFLKKIIKIIIIEKGLDINRLKCKSDVPYKLA